jgi:hypothetical protein
MCITYFECIFIPLGIQHAMLLRHIVIYGLLGSTILFPHYLINGTIKKKRSKTKCVSWFYLQLLSEILFVLRISERDMIKKMRICLRAKCPLFLSDFNKLEFSRQVFEKRSNIKFHENPSSGSRVVSCGQRDRQR